MSSSAIRLKMDDSFDSSSQTAASEIKIVDYLNSLATKTYSQSLELYERYNRILLDSKNLFVDSCFLLDFGLVKSVVVNIAIFSVTSIMFNIHFRFLFVFFSASVNGDEMQIDDGPYMDTRRISFHWFVYFIFCLFFFDALVGRL